MLAHSLTSLELFKTENYVPQALDDHDGLHKVVSKNSSKSLRLTRNPTHLSEISRIILGIRDDRDLDSEQYESYCNNMEPEALLAKQLECVPSKDETHLEKSDHPVDGAFAFWQAVLVMLMVFLTWGTNAAFGIFLNYYLSSDSFPGASKYDFALMGGMVVFLAQLLAPFSTLAVRVFGQTPVLVTGICIQTLGYLLAAECTQLWQIFMCQGVLIGISFSLIFIPGTLVIPTWFDKSKALAMGIAVSGAGLGGLVYSLALNSIIQNTGDQKWALRTAGLMNLVISLFGTLFLRPRNKQKVLYKNTLNWAFVKNTSKVVFNFKIFLHWPLFITGVWFGIVLLGYVIILYSFAAVATSVGMSHTQSSNILAVLNALQVVGRPLIGNFGDSFGRNNTAIVICLYVGILLTAFWLNATSYVSIMLLATFIGGPVGIGSLMAQSLAYDILAFRGIPEKIPAAWGGLNIIVSVFSLPAEVIALKLQVDAGAKSYRHAQIFTGCCFFFAALLMIFNREWLIRQTLMVRRKQAEEHLGQISQPGNETCPNPGIASEEEKTATNRVDRYNQLLGANPVYFVLRMFYPIRV
ncbi:MFS general substrate transporter [Metschnikowia bicuspidata var. bicuspidata NRRL YB-4993]|uniref:MFS general substrate transporter n=1 Tax=Metschnikowia bicuspidata var. bicuspidata NRRL YB-4993 TaxID=869754 RepID=A0A1A0H680_9ASCO|nr:MFS general substrate transporter [Metschnikowia bicuspidata var. bicuspidata NRRL YB-4993]OBA19536.1 MFS general substrate transporter [Metschnikowia bicuspidata var. bicuspidata NRRL YB-4993]